MAGGKLTPRQKMINMMYLVLTALLALNISREIIDAFVLINDSIEKTTLGLIGRNELTYNDLEQARLNDPIKAEIYWRKAQEVKTSSEEMFFYIESLKKELMGKTDQLTKAQQDTVRLNWVEKKDENNIPSEIMIGSRDDGKGGKAAELRKKIEQYRERLKSVLAIVGGAKEVQLGLDTSDPPATVEGGRVSWEQSHFDNMPLAPAIVMLSKLQADVKSAEGDVVNYLRKKIGLLDFKFDTIAAKVIAQSSYVPIGSEYRADVFVAAFSTTSNPQIWLGHVDSAGNFLNGSIDSGSVMVDKGVGHYVIKPTREGEQKWGGVIRMKNPKNEIVSYPFSASFIAAKPNAVVSVDKMNVMYLGVDNPVSVSLPGIPSEKIKPSISQGSLVKNSDGTYTAKLLRTGEAVIIVSAEIDGRIQQVGKPVPFRVKMIPNPVVKVANRNGGTITKSELLAQGGIIPVLDNFEFQAYFTITSYKIMVDFKRKEDRYFDVSGNRIPEEARRLFQTLAMGDRVYFENVKAVGPDRITRDLGTISFTIR